MGLLEGIEPCETAGDIRGIELPALIGLWLCCWVGEGPVEYGKLGC
jgi:hypothetical protein